MKFSNFATAMALFLLAIISVAPAGAHRKGHPESAAHAAPSAVQPANNGNAAAPSAVSPPNDGHMAGMMEEMAKERAAMSTGERLLDWLGRLHPIVVHFPIAFFPAALFTAIVGRRRAAFGKPVQFLVVAGGIVAPIAAVLGWLDAMGADPGSLLTVHRWLGTAIGVAAMPLGLWAWRKPGQNRGPGMIIGLAIITAAIIVQGWYGGALLHGMDHMNW